MEPVLHEAIPTVVDEAGIFKLPASSIIKATTKNNIDAKNGRDITFSTGSTPGQAIRFEIPAEHYWKVDDTTLHFTISMPGYSFYDYHPAYSNTNIHLAVNGIGNGAGTDGSRFKSYSGILVPKYISQCINRLVIQHNSKIIEDINEYPFIVNVINSAQSETYLKTTGVLFDGNNFNISGMECGAYADEFSAFGDDPFFIKGELRRMLYIKELNDVWNWKNFRTSSANFTGAGFIQASYGIKLHSGLLKTKKFLPVKYIGTIVIDIYLSSFNEIFTLYNRRHASTTSLANGSRPIVSVSADVASRDIDGSLSGRITEGGISSAVGSNVNNPTYVSHYDFGRLDAQGANEAGGEPNLVGDAYVFTAAIPLPPATFSRFFLNITTVIPTEAYDKAMVELLQSSQGLQLHFSSFHTHLRPMNAGTIQNVNISENAGSIKNVFVFVRDPRRASKRTRMTHYGTFPGITQYQFRVGTQMIPSAPVIIQSTSGQNIDLTIVKKETLRALGRLEGTESCYLTDDYYRHGNFFIGCNLEKSPGYISGLNTNLVRTDIQLNMQLMNNIAENLIYGSVAVDNSWTFNIIVHYDVVLDFRGIGRLDVNK